MHNVAAGRPAALVWFLPGLLAPIALHVAVATGDGLPVVTGLLAAQAAIAWLVLRRRPALLILAVAAIGLAAVARGFGATEALMLASGGSHAAIFTGLAIGFAGSLRGGSVDVVTALAIRIDPLWTPTMAGYTRAVTKAWAVFFALQVIVSAGLFLVASREAWSFFVNILDLPLVALMFLAEGAVRRRRFPGRRHLGLASVVAAMRAGTAR